MSFEKRRKYRRKRGKQTLCVLQSHFLLALLLLASPHAEFVSLFEYSRKAFFLLLNFRIIARSR
jgi:hypothetical protein